MKSIRRDFMYFFWGLVVIAVLTGYCVVRMVMRGGIDLFYLIVWGLACVWAVWMAYTVYLDIKRFKD